MSGVEIEAHMQQLIEARDHAEDSGERLSAVLGAYAIIEQERHGHHECELAAFLHRDEHVAHAGKQLQAMVRGLVLEAAKAGLVRSDVGADELANYCLHALAAVRDLSSKAAVRRLVEITLTGLRPTLATS